MSWNNTINTKERYKKYHLSVRFTQSISKRTELVDLNRYESFECQNLNRPMK